MNDSLLIELPSDSEVLEYTNIEEQMERKLHEVCINHRLAFYMEKYINKEFEEKYYVDIEYNRYYKNKKHLSIDGIDTIVRPDIVIHTRTETCGCVQHYLVVEAKKDIDSEEDKKVVRSFLTDTHYNYKFGLNIIYQKFNPVKVYLFYKAQNNTQIICEKLFFPL